MRGGWLRFGPPLAVLVIYLAALAPWFLGDAEAYRRTAGALVPEAFGFPFLDTHVVLAWAECAARGVDVYATNPCDALGRTLAQSPLWLRLGHLDVTTAWTDIAGLFVGLTFVLALFLLPPARGTGPALVLLVAFCSPAVAYGLERANTDLLMFAAVVGGAVLARRWVGYGLILLAGLLKFYPLAALVILARERQARVVASGLAIAAVLAVFVAVYAADLARLSVVTGHWYGSNFGAICLVEGLPALWPGQPLLARVVIWAFGALALCGAWMMYRRASADTALAALPGRERAVLMASASVAMGSFCVLLNGGYRAIFLLPVVAVLARLGRGYATIITLALFALWALLLPHVRAPFAFDTALLLSWLLAQAVWWALAGTLAGLLLAMLQREWAAGKPA